MNSATAAIGTAVAKQQVNSMVNSVTAATDTSPKATGYLGPYCGKQCFGFTTGTFVRLCLMASMMFFLFIALCVPALQKGEYSIGNTKVEFTCRHSKFEQSPGSEEKYKDLGNGLNFLCDGDDFGKKNGSAASSFTGCSWFAFLLMIANLPLLYAIDFPGLLGSVPFITEENVIYVNGALGVFTWIFLTSNWGSWNAQNCCGDTNANNVKAGASWSLAVLVWVIDLFYLAFCIPDFDEIMFGEK